MRSQLVNTKSWCNNKPNLNFCNILTDVRTLWENKNTPPTSRDNCRYAFSTRE